MLLSTGDGPTRVAGRPVAAGRFDALARRRTVEISSIVWMRRDPRQDPVIDAAWPEAPAFRLDRPLVEGGFDARRPVVTVEAGFQTRARSDHAPADAIRQR
ncbi:MAG: hypothetical protein QM674_15085 [Burkholderiaceae bacterium]